MIQNKWKRILLIILIFTIVLTAAFFIIREIAYRHRSVPDGIIAYESDNPHMADKKTKISAHRSGAGIAPEDTLKAFKLCVEDIGFDVDYFEFDQHITKDNVLILLHDNELDRTSDCETVFGKSNCRPEDYTYKQLRQLNIRVYHPGFQVIQIPFNDKNEDHYINTATVSLLNYAHSHGIAVQYWTINTQEDAEYLLSIGADGIITDYPDMVYELRERK